MGLTRNQVVIVAILLAGATLVVLNQTLLSPAYPSIMVDLQVDATTVQWLTSAYSLVEAIVIPLSAFLIGRFPTRKLFIAGVSVFALGSLMAAFSPFFGILLLGRPVIRILAGAEYLPAYPVTVMLIAGIIPMSYFKIIGTLLLAQGKKGVYLGMLSASVLVNILCNMLTIPLWGKMGAAVASVVSYAVAGFVFLGYYLRTYSIPLNAVFVFSPAEKAKLMSKLGAVKRKLGKKKAV